MIRLAMGIGGWLFAAVYDRMTARAEAAGIGAYREHLLSGARGRVLEIGAGTGANFPFYREGVESVTLAEPEGPMARKLERRIQAQSQRSQQSWTAEIVRAPAERLPFADAEFDTAVSTLVLCTVTDQVQALCELRRVLKPGGRLLFLEHVRSDEPGLAAWQDRLNGLNRVVACGCNCNRATLDAIRAAGFRITSLKRDQFPKAPPFVRPLVVGTAESGAAAP